MILKLILLVMITSVTTSVTDVEMNEIKMLNNTHEAYFENMHTERFCIVAALWYEAGNQPFDGKLAVAIVLKNRVESKRWYPTTYCGVIKQKNQFSFIRIGKLDIPDNTLAWSSIREIIFISKLLEIKNYDMFNFLLDKDMLDATSFHSLDSVHGCSWCSDMQYIDTIGDHHFLNEEINMSDYVVPNDPKVKEKIRKVIGDVVSVMQQIADKRSYITDALKALKEEHQVPPAIARKMAKTAFKGNYDAVVDEDDAFQIYYENIVRQVATSPTQESDD